MSHLTHLRTFLDAYRTGSFSKAAEHLNITQPAASMHIQALESLVGKALFLRQARGVTPTAAADELARTIAPYLDGLEAKLATLRVDANGVSGTVHIAGPAELFDRGVAEALIGLSVEGLQVRLHTGNKERIYALLKDGTADLAITASMPDEQAHAFIRLATERLLLVLAPALAARLGRKLSQQALAALPILAYDEHLPLIRPVWHAMFQSTPSMQATFTVPDLRVIERLLIQGHGWSVLPDYLCGEALAAGKLMALNRARQVPRNELYLAWNQGALRHPRVARVRDRLREAFATPPRR